MENVNPVNHHANHVWMNPQNVLLVIKHMFCKKITNVLDFVRHINIMKKIKENVFPAIKPVKLALEHLLIIAIVALKVHILMVVNVYLSVNLIMYL